MTVGIVNPLVCTVKLCCRIFDILLSGFLLNVKIPTVVAASFSRFQKKNLEVSLKVSQKYQEVSRATPAFTVYLKYQKVSRATCPLLLFTESIKKYPGPHAHFYYLQKVSKSILGHKPTSAFYFRVIRNYSKF